MLHEVRVPVQFSAAREQLLAVREGRHEPLTRRHDLEGPFALFVELDGVRDRTDLANQLAALLQCLNDDRSHLVDGAPFELRVELVGALGVATRELLAREVTGEEASVTPD